MLTFATSNLKTTSNNMKIFAVSVNYGQLVYAAESKEQLLEYLKETNNDVLRIHEREIIPGKVCFLGGHQE